MTRLALNMLRLAWTVGAWCFVLGVLYVVVELL